MKAILPTFTVRAKMFENLKKKQKRKKEGRRKATSADCVSVPALCMFDGPELSLMYKLQCGEAAAEGNGVYFCSK